MPKEQLRCVKMRSTFIVEDNRLTKAAKNICDND